MPKPSKKFRRNREKIPTEPVSVDEAVKILQSLEGAKFDETVEVSLKLGIDPKNTAQMVRGAYSLPHGIGKKVRVIAFAEGEAATAAKAAGAVEVGAEDLAKKILDGWLDFDVAVAHPAMMRHVGKLGRVLGPHGKMPSPKSGTVTDNVAKAVEEFNAGKVEFRNDSGGNIHALIGKKSFDAEKLAANCDAFIAHIGSLRPAASKGTFLVRGCLASTMSPGIPLQLGA